MFYLNLVLWHHTNAWCNNLEGIIELVVYGYFMASLDKRKPYKKKVYIAVAAGIVITLVDIFFIHGFWMLGTTAIIAQNIIQAVLVFNYYYNLIHNLDEYPDLISYPPFLAATGLLLYSLANCFYFTTFDYLAYKKDYQYPMIVQVIHEISNVFLYTLLGVAFLCFLRTKKLS
jgi:heme A synthase